MLFFERSRVIEGDIKIGGLQLLDQTAKVKAEEREASGAGDYERRFKICDLFSLDANLRVNTHGLDSDDDDESSYSEIE